MKDILDGDEFFSLCQEYRHMPLAPQAKVIASFERLKKWIREHKEDLR